MWDKCETIGEVHKFLTSMMVKECKVKYSIANSVRTFAKDYAKEVHDPKLAMFVLYHAYERLNTTGKHVSQSYFESILNRAFKCEKDDLGVLYVRTNVPIIRDKDMVKRIL